MPTIFCLSAGSFVLVLLGSMLNLLVRTVNNGKIPVLISDKIRDEPTFGLDFGHVTMTEGTHLNILGDKFHFYCMSPLDESFLTYPCATSIGDFLMFIGLSAGFLFALLFIATAVTVKLKKKLNL